MRLGVSMSVLKSLAETILRHRMVIIKRLAELWLHLLVIIQIIM